MHEEIEDPIDLEKVYKLLTTYNLFLGRKKHKLLSQFAELLAQKSSFSHKVHKSFEKFTTQ